MMRGKLSCKIIPLYVLILSVSFSGCKPDNTDITDCSNKNMRTFVDMKGKKVTIPVDLKRIALFGGPSGQIAYLLGAKDRLCAITKTLRTSSLSIDFFPGILKLPAPRTTSGCINLEELIGAQPELVIACNTDGGIVQKKTKIPVAYLEDSMDQGVDVLKREIRFYASVLKAEKRGEKYIKYLEDTLCFLKKRLGNIPKEQRKIVFNGYNPSHLVTLGGDTFVQERIEAAGCLNAAKVIATVGKKQGLHSGLDEVSMEQVLGWDPDILVINSGSPDSLYKDSRWKHVKAVKNRQVLIQPAGFYVWNRPSAEAAVLFPLWLAKHAYPEKLKDINMVDEVKKFYGEIFDFKLTNAQVLAILNGEYKDRIMKGKY